MKHFYTNLTFFFLAIFSGFTQSEPTDCVNALVICGDSNLGLTPTSSGTPDFQGNPNNNMPNCFDDKEHKTSWIKVIIDQPGTLAFDIIPNGNDDYDFAVYGPDKPCNALGRSIRCSFADPTEFDDDFNEVGNNSSVPTGLNNTANDTSEGAGGDGYVEQINVNAGEEYYILVDNYENSEDGFTINFTGTSAFPSEPVNAATGSLDITECDTLGDTSDGITTFNLEANTAAIIGSQTNVVVTYHLTEQDAIINNNSLTSPYTNTQNNQDIYIRIEDTRVGCFVVVDNFMLIGDGVGLPPIEEPTDYNLCDDNTDGFVNGFILNTKDSEVLIGLNAGDYTVTYHLNQADATNGVAAINKDTPYTNISNPQTIYVRGEGNNNQSCASSDSFTQFNLTVGSSLSIENPTPYNLCDNDTDGISNDFLLNTKDSEILNGQIATDFEVTYHLTQADANNGTGAIDKDNPYTNISNPQTIYVRAVGSTSNNQSCANTPSFAQFDLVIESSPQISEATDYNLCDDDDDGFVTGFILRSKDFEALEGLDPGVYTITYHLTQEDAINGVAAIDKFTPYTNISNPQTIYVSGIITNNQTCASTETYTQFDLIVGSSLVITDPIPYGLCDDDTDGISDEFLLNTKDTELLNGQNADNFDISYHLTEEDAINGVAAIDKNNPYTNVSNPQIIYVRSIGSSTNLQDCTSTPSFAQFELVVESSPSISEPTDYSLCDNNTARLPADFILNIKDAEILAGLNAADYTITYHLTQADATNGNAAIDKDIPYTNIQNPQTIYVRGEHNIESQVCNNTITFTTFDLIVGKLPSVIETEISQCDSFEDPTDGITQFNLTENNALISTDATNVTFAFFETLAQATAGTPEITNSTAYQNTARNQEIFVSVTNNETGCSSITTIKLSVSGINGNNTTLVLCDTSDGAEDGIVSFDLTQANDQVLSGLSLPNIELTYHPTSQDAINETNVITTVLNTTPYSQGQDIIYARVEDSQQCFSINEVQLFVTPDINITSTEELMICDNEPDASINTSLIENNLDPNEYTFIWSTGQTTESITINQGGVYTVEITNPEGCTKTRTITVTQSGAATIESIIINDGTNSSSVTVNVSGSGDYEYALETEGILSAYQDNTTFTDVAFGPHTVYVRDKDGCLPITTQDIWVIGFPQYFTPNGDGIHEAWNVLGLPPQGNARSAIYIFNRHGKLLKQLEPNDLGWDGTYQGKKLPSSQYWYKMELGDGSVKTGSFSLIR